VCRNGGHDRSDGLLSTCTWCAITFATWVSTQYGSKFSSGNIDGHPGFGSLYVLFLRMDFLVTEFFHDGHPKKSGHIHVIVFYHEKKFLAGQPCPVALHTTIDT
jgi:hypothetical protein